MERADAPRNLLRLSLMTSQASHPSFITTSVKCSLKPVSSTRLQHLTDKEPIHIKDAAHNKIQKPAQKWSWLSRPHRRRIEAQGEHRRARARQEDHQKAKDDRGNSEERVDFPHHIHFHRQCANVLGTPAKRTSPKTETSLSQRRLRN
jgi:hypothetical protein